MLYALDLHKNFLLAWAKKWGEKSCFIFQICIWMLFFWVWVYYTNVQRYKFTMVKEKKQIDNTLLFGENKWEFLFYDNSSSTFRPHSFLPGIYTFRSFLKRVSTRRFGIFQVASPLCPGKWRVASPLNRRATDPSARLTRKSTTDKHTSKDLTVTEVAPADRISWFVLQLEFSRQSQRCLSFICTRWKPRTLFPASFNSLNSFDCILIKIITLISMEIKFLWIFFFFFFRDFIRHEIVGGMTFKETKQNRTRE